jgi:hypothetical protein
MQKFLNKTEQVSLQWYDLKNKRVDALRLKRGPSESGTLPQPPPSPRPVGGEIAPIDRLAVFLSQYGLLLLVLLIPLAFLFYKKRSSLMTFFWRARMAFWRLKI